jgi:hypothetical protein
MQSIVIYYQNIDEKDQIQKDNKLSKYDVIWVKRDGPTEIVALPK